MDNAFEFLKNLQHFVPPATGVKKASDLFSLDAELALLNKLNNPQNDLKYIHVAGTNGKGSTSSYIASILKEAGLKVGLFTSPFLYAYNEMFKIDGVDISDVDFQRIFSIVEPAYDELVNENIVPSEYEILTVMSFLYFKEMKCDIVVMEVSMGGRVDTTNVIPSPLVTVMTPISYDHMTILGNTLTEIATEKAGIIKKRTSVVSALQENEVKEVLKIYCEKCQVPLFYLSKPELIERSLKGQKFRVEGIDLDLETKLLGTYQLNNASLAIKAVKILNEKGYEIDDKAILNGIKNTSWFGRFTLLQENPPIIIDGGHNRQGAFVLAESLKAYFPDKKITFILGILKDKEVDRMLDTLLPIAKEVYTVDVKSARSMSAKELCDLVAKKGVKAAVLNDINEIKYIKSDSDVYCMAGSLYMLGSLQVD